MRILAWLGLLCAGAGCAVDDAPGEVVSSAAQAVVDGELSGPELGAVVLVVYEYDPATPGAFLLGSGVLIAPNVLVTARHTIADSSPPSYTNSAPYVCGGNGEPIEDGNGGGYVSADGNPQDIKVYVGNYAHDIVSSPPSARGVEVFHDGAVSLCSHDIAFVLLDREIEDVPPMQLRWTTPPAVDETVTLVAWGLTNGSDTSFQPRSHYSDALPIIAVGPEIPDPTFEGIDTVPRTFDTGPAVCDADSGGGALDDEGRLLGIAVRFTGVVSPNAPDPCAVSTNHSVYMQVRLFADVVDAVFAAAGHAPWLEGSPEPGTVSAGEPCGADHDCESMRCEQREQGSVCARPCAADAECTGGDVCLADTGFCAARDEPASGCSLAAPPSGSRWGLLLVSLGCAASARRRRPITFAGRAGAGSRIARAG